MIYPNYTGIDINKMKFITWNVNGIRTKIFSHLSSGQIARTKQVEPVDGSPISNLLKLDPDFMCFQETRCSTENGEKLKIPGYKSVFNSSKKDGARDANRYSGTCIYYKDKYTPNSIEFQIPNHLDEEGRIIIMKFDTFVLINVYTPNSGTNFPERLMWQTNMLNFLKSIEGQVIYCGDMNVAWTDRDVHFKIKESPTYKNVNTDTVIGLLPEEIEFMKELKSNNYVDAHDTQGLFDHFTYWDARSKKIEGLPGARYKNHGWRIDYFLTKNSNTIECRALQQIGTEYIKDGQSQCSDHCPVYYQN